VTQGGKVIANHTSKASCEEHLRRRYAATTAPGADTPANEPPSDTQP
jgi:hypothetical protein